MITDKNAGYDELARILREMALRFGESAFVDRRRMLSFLADRLPEDRRDIRVVAGAAVDERVSEALARARPEQFALEIERVAARLQNGLGIRSDIAVPVVQAFAYGLSLGPLPSGATASQQNARPEPSRPDGPDGWVGVSEPVRSAPAHPPSPASPNKGMGIPTWLKWSGGGAAVIVVGLIFASVRMQPETPAPAPVPAPALAPAPAPAPASAPTPSPRPPAQQSSFFGDEDADFHVPPQAMLRPNDRVGTPTPLTIPGAVTVTTVQVYAEMQKTEQARGVPLLIVDAWADAHPVTIKGAVTLPGANQGGTFTDSFQGDVVRELNALSHGRKDMWLVFFCQSVRCWESYNAALRSRAAGYANVFWYRGGMYAWLQSGFPTQSVN